MAMVLWHLRSLCVPFLSDDYLMVRYLSRESGAVLWSRVLGEFTSPWFGVHDMYRPLVSLSYGIELQLWGACAVCSHAVNLGLLAVTAAAVAFTGSRFGPRIPGLAALVAGLCVVLHPATVEVSSWMAARTAALETMFSTLAMAMLVRRAVTRRSCWPVWSCTLLALLSKEGALVLPAVLLGLDLVLRGRAALRDLRLHLVLWLVLAALLLWRLLVLGLVVSGAGAGPVELLVNLRTHVTAAIAPPGTDQATARGGGAAGGVRRRGALRWRGALLLLLTALALLPVSRIAALDVAWSGRLELAAVPILGLTLALATMGASRSWTRWLGVTGVVAMLFAWAVGSVRWMNHYQRGGAVVSGLAASLQAAPAAARPLGLLMVDGGGVPVTLLHQEAWYLLGQRPFAPVDQPLLGLGSLLQGSGPLYLDLSPARALSMPVAAWRSGSRGS